MGDKKKQGHRGLFGVLWDTWLRPGQPDVLNPLFVYIPQEEHRKLPMHKEPFWFLCMAWIRYYSVQWRWDIERGMARLLHRRWT